MINDAMTRREALRRASLLVGGAAVLPGVLAACERGSAAAGKAGGTGGAWAPRTLSPAQAEMVATIGEHIIPQTDTPGARAARVQEFVDTILTDFLPPQPRAQFLAGLERVDRRAERAFGRPFLGASPQQQLQLVAALNRAAYSGPDAPSHAVGRRGKRRGGAPDAEPMLQAGEVTTSGSVGGGAVAASVEAPGGQLAPEDVGRNGFFMTLKRLVIEGYYTSQPGATQELRVAPFGPWRADIPYAQVGHAWA